MQRGACIGCKSYVILRRQFLAKALSLGLAGVLTMTVPAMPASAQSACDDPPYREFDFWIGHWQVRLADGRLAGENRIEASADGCYLVERWQGARGSAGFSLNFYEPELAGWRQVWVSADSTIEISGGLVGDSMVLEGEIRYRQPVDPDRSGGETAGPRRPFRGTWTPLPGNRVRQLFEERRVDGEDGDRWQTWFEGFYGKVVE